VFFGNFAVWPTKPFPTEAEKMMIKNSSAHALDGVDGKSESENQCWLVMVQSVVALGLFTCQIADVATTSVLTKTNNRSTKRR